MKLNRQQYVLIGAILAFLLSAFLLHHANQQPSVKNQKDHWEWEVAGQRDTARPSENLPVNAEAKATPRPSPTPLPMDSIPKTHAPKPTPIPPMEMPLWLVGSIRQENGELLDREVSVSLMKLSSEGPLGHMGAGAASIDVAKTKAETTATDYYELPVTGTFPFALVVEGSDGLTGQFQVPISLMGQTRIEGQRRVIDFPLTVKQGTVFRGRVVSDSGDAISGAEVVPFVSTETHWMRPLSMAITDEKGEFSLTLSSVKFMKLNISATDWVSAGFGVTEFTETVAVYTLQSEGGMISGVLLDASGGEPVPGAVVECYAGKPPNMSNSNPVSAKTITDENGRFVLKPLSAGRWDLVAAATDKASVLGFPTLAQTSVSLGELEIRDDVALVFDAGYDLRVLVVDDATEEPLEGVHLYRTSNPREMRGGVYTDAEGTAILKGFPTYLRNWNKEGAITIEKESYLEGKLDSEIPEIVEGVAQEVVRLNRADTVLLSGRVVGVDGSPVGNVYITGNSELEESRTYSDQTGNFELAVLQNEPLKLKGSFGDLPDSWSSLIEVGEKPIHNVRLTLDPGAQLKVKVVNESGNPVPNSNVFLMRRIYAKTHWSSASHSLPGVTDEHGEILFDVLLPTSGAELDIQLESVSVDIAVSHESYNPIEEMSIPLEASIINEVTITLPALDRSGEFDGFVRDPDGNPIEGVFVQIQNDDFVTGYSDALGFFHFEDLIPGEVYIQFDHSKYQTNGNSYDIPQLDVKVTMEPLTPAVTPP